ncbi:4-coumarate-CoA ligase [Phytophthora palmivora]|uniref:4-coumarate-CoA ligase n=1 Tax=Phytophthora palmivora TaxID=4796 RepID=A0A2P4XD24_9STRA|nr:4-coumarate-CoA ligase [Phytophthora palmivora]
MVFSSPHGVISIPENKTAWDWVEEHAVKIPNKPAYICAITERILTFADVHNQARKICAALAVEGIKKGDVVTLHSFNCVEYPVIFLALTRLGAVCSTASPMFHEEELADQLKHSESVAIITNAKMVDTAVKAASLSGIELNRVYTIGHDISTSLLSIEDMLAKDIPFPNLPPVDPEAIVAMPFSSGTTARPKGVLLTGRALFAGAMMASHSEKDMEYTMTVLPFFHIMSTLLFHMAFYRGWGTIILPKFMPDEYLRAIVKYKVWNVYVAPPIVQFFAKHPTVDKYDLSCLKYIGAGGAPMGTEVEEAVFKRIGAKVGQGYGMTELCGPVTMPAYEINRPGSVGQLLPNSRLRVKSLSTEADLGPNEVGELLIHTPAMMEGYFNNPEETKNSITEDSFVHTGDVGYIDDDGFIFIVDRVKEMIKYKGHQVAPAELEDVLHGHPAVVDSCCVRGRDLDSGEELPKAFVVLREGASTSPEDIMEYVGEKVAPYKRVRQVEFVDAIPKTMSGKILRRQLQLREDNKIKAAMAP